MYCDHAVATKSSIQMVLRIQNATTYAANFMLAGADKNSAV